MDVLTHNNIGRKCYKVGVNVVTFLSGEGPSLEILDLFYK